MRQLFIYSCLISAGVFSFTLGAIVSHHLLLCDLAAPGNWVSFQVSFESEACVIRCLSVLPIPQEEHNWGIQSPLLQTFFFAYHTTKACVSPWCQLNKVHWKCWLPGQRSTSITQWEVAPTEGKHGSVRGGLVGGESQIFRHKKGNDIRGIHPSF